MTRIRLFVTGKTEEALHQPLSRMFPSAEFETVLVNGFTSSRLDGTRPTLRAQETLGALVGAVQRNGGADYAILVDDLELVNVSNAAGVVGYFRSAAKELATSKSHPTVRALRERVSVHLLAPMIEAYFFPDPAALAAAGVTAKVTPSFSDATPEEFSTEDAPFLAPPTDPTDVLTARPRVQRWRTAARRVNPKHYLMYLLDESGSDFSEVGQCRAALRALDLNTAWASKAARWSFLGAMVDDIAAMLKIQSVTPRVSAALTKGPGEYLRNL